MSKTYERLTEDNNFPYFVDALGGAGIDSFNAPVPGSDVRYAGDYGAMLIDSLSDHITFQFMGAWDHAGEPWCLPVGDEPVYPLIEGGRRAIQVRR